MLAPCGRTTGAAYGRSVVTTVARFRFRIRENIVRLPADQSVRGSILSARVPIRIQTTSAPIPRARLFRQPACGNLPPSASRGATFRSRPRQRERDNLPRRAFRLQLSASSIQDLELLRRNLSWISGQNSFIRLAAASHPTNVPQSLAASPRCLSLPTRYVVPTATEVALPKNSEKLN